MQRFYKNAGFLEEADGFAVALDGKPVKTPGGRPLTVPSQAVARAAADEWAAQGEQVDPAAMPVTRFVSSVLDGVAARADEVAEAVVAYGATDLLCYRADGDADLAAEQRRLWDPPLDWLAATHSVELVAVNGIRPVEQPAEALERLGALVHRRDPWRLAGLHTATTVTGSAVLALALDEGAFGLERVWQAAMLEEMHQIARWGDDEEARKRRAGLRRELEEAAAWLALLEG